jgi:hypothetical protein
MEGMMTMEDGLDSLVGRACTFWTRFFQSPESLLLLSFEVGTLEIPQVEKETDKRYPT